MSIDQTSPSNSHFIMGSTDSPSITENSAAIKAQSLVETTNEMQFDPGNPKECLGRPEPFILPKKPTFVARICGRAIPIPLRLCSTYQTSMTITRQYVKADGSCWSRSTWQSILNQGLKDDNFSGFMTRIATRATELQVNEGILKNTLTILHQLKSCPDEDSRRNLLNHEEIDKTLISFMRHVDFQTEVVVNKCEAQNAHLIKNRDDHSQDCGTPTLRNVAKFFDSQVKVLEENEKTHTWRTQDLEPNTTNNLNKPTEASLNEKGFLQSVETEGTIVFGCNLKHFEVLRVSQPETKPPKQLNAKKLTESSDKFSFSKFFKNLFSPKTKSTEMEKTTFKASTQFPEVSNGPTKSKQNPKKSDIEFIGTTGGKALERDAEIILHLLKAGTSRAIQSKISLEDVLTLKRYLKGPEGLNFLTHFTDDERIRISENLKNLQGSTLALIKSVSPPDQPLKNS